MTKACAGTRRMTSEIEYVVATSPGSATPFQCECRSVPGLTLVQNLEDNRFLCRFAPGTHTIFARHRFPVSLSSPVANPESLNSVVEILLGRINLEALRAQPVSFQVTASWPLSWDSSDLEKKLIEQGLPENIPDKNAQTIVSLYLHRWCDTHTLFAGASSVEENLSVWEDVDNPVVGPDDELGASEHRFVEAERVFGPFGSEGKALDLGAAPGGWSRVLAGRGFQVDAVDSEELAPSVSAHEMVTSHTVPADEFLETATERYQLIVCDTTAGSGIAVETLLKAQHLLSPDGRVLAVINLKKSRTILGEARKAIAILGQAYTVCQARQLPFNKLAITVLLKPL